MQVRLRRALMLPPGAVVRSRNRLNADTNGQTGLLDRIEPAEPAGRATRSARLSLALRRGFKLEGPEG